MIHLGLYVFGLIGGLGIAGIIVCCLIATFTLRKKFDKQFKKLPAGIFDPQLPIISTVLYRPFAYMGAIAMETDFSKKRKYNYFYGDYNFKKHANNFEIILSRIFVCIFVIPSCLAIFIWGVFYTLAKLMGIPTDF